MHLLSAWLKFEAPKRGDAPKACKTPVELRRLPPGFELPTALK